MSESRIVNRLTFFFLSSGKSLIYQIPVLESLLKDQNSKAMYIFPTKALAQDQKRALEAIMHQIPNLEQIMVLY